MDHTRPNRILVVGTGGREHALAWRCADEGHEVLATPGSDGIALHARCVSPPGGPDGSDAEMIARLARDEAVDLVVVGPEQPLVDGLADRLRAAGIATFGPSAAAAELEGSKSAAKAFMARHRIPTAGYRTVTTLDEGRAALRAFERPPVVKASGLAAGKGVTVCDTHEQAEQALRACLTHGVFGDAGSTVVLEERLEGEEVSFFAITDGHRFATFLAAQDHKRLEDGDRGPNTGGMGAYLPAPVCDDEVKRKICERVVEPTLAGLRAEGRPFTGVLFCGLMISPAGDPFVVEYNVRFGDPETQALLYGLETPLVPLLLGAAHGELSPLQLQGKPAAVVVVASAGYPASSTKGVEIAGLDAMARLDDVAVFHAGTRREGDTWLTNGGRVLGVCARADQFGAAIARAYQALEHLKLEGGQWRHDVGQRGIRRMADAAGPSGSRGKGS